LLFVASLFKSNLSIYEVHNNGAWYNVGYLFGLAGILGGGNRTARRPPNPIRLTAPGFLFGLPTQYKRAPLLE
jgi:hypothetical protein